MKIHFFPSPELGDIYCSDYSFTIKTRCSYPERKSDFETKTKTLLSIIQIDKVRSKLREQDFALKRADCCFGALKVVLRLGCAFTPFGKPGVKGQRTSRKKTNHHRCHALGTLHLSMSIDTDHRVVRQTGKPEHSFKSEVDPTDVTTHCSFGRAGSDLERKPYFTVNSIGARLLPDFLFRAFAEPPANAASVVLRVGLRRQTS